VEGFILKILSGPQSGAEVLLSPGEYRLGSGDEDDLQFNDLSLESGHARLRVSAGTVEISADSGEISTGNGLKLAGEDDGWREIEQLDVISMGMVRFAIGAPTANWTTLFDAEGHGADGGEQGRLRNGAGLKAGALGALRNVFGGEIPPLRRRVAAAFAAGATAVCLLMLAVIAFNSGDEDAPVARTDRVRDLAAIEKAVAKLPFADAVAVRQEVDGEVFVSGYVESLAERRAIANAVENAGASAKVRIWVLSVMRHGLDQLSQSIGHDFHYELSDNGDLKISGVILDPAEAERVERLVHEQVVGLRSVESDIISADSLLKKVTELAKRTNVAETVLFRLDGPLIEASGVIPAEKVDIWAGFISSYVQNIAQYIPLRSYVQLAVGQAGNRPIATAAMERASPDRASIGIFPGPAAAVGTENPATAGVPETPVVIEKTTISKGSKRFDVNRFKAGDYNVRELFAGQYHFPDKGSTGIEEPERRAPAQLFAGAPRRPPTGPSDNDAPARSTAGSDGDSSAENEKRETSRRARGKLPPRGRRPAEGSVVLDDIKIGAFLSRLDTRNSPSNRICGILYPDPAGSLGPKPRSTADGLRLIDATHYLDPAKFVPLTVLTRDLIDAWLSGSLDRKDGETIKGISELAEDMDRLAGLWTESVLRQTRGLNAPPEDYKTIMRLLHSQIAPCPAAAPACWPGSMLDGYNLSAALFWLDLLSLSDLISLADFNPRNKAVILEAGLNPRRVANCAARRVPEFNLTGLSLYIAESANNAGVAHILADRVGHIPLPISGANISGERYIQTTSGRKFREGSSPTATSRLLHIGELGALLQSGDEVAISVYTQDISWFFDDVPQVNR
jgi:type III secretion system YscD/HrpQ family protein